MEEGSLAHLVRYTEQDGEAGAGGESVSHSGSSRSEAARAMVGGWVVHTGERSTSHDPGDLLQDTGGRL